MISAKAAWSKSDCLAQGLSTNFDMEAFHLIISRCMIQNKRDFTLESKSKPFSWIGWSQGSEVHLTHSCTTFLVILLGKQEWVRKFAFVKFYDRRMEEWVFDNIGTSIITSHYQETILHEGPWFGLHLSMSGCFRLLDHEHEMLEVHQGVTCRSCQQAPLLGRRVSSQLECLGLTMALFHQSVYRGFP